MFVVNQKVPNKMRRVNHRYQLLNKTNLELKNILKDLYQERDWIWELTKNYFYVAPKGALKEKWNLNQRKKYDILLEDCFVIIQEIKTVKFMLGHAKKR